MPDKNAEYIAFEIHRTLQDYAPQFSSKARPKAMVNWEELPKNDKNFMIAVVDELLKRGVIIAGQESQRRVSLRFGREGFSIQGKGRKAGPSD